MMKKVLSILLAAAIFLVMLPLGAFADSAEVLKEAKAALVFSALSDESIQCVTENLRLPISWKDGCVIYWTSGDENVIAIDGETGVIKRPSYGEGIANVLLTAYLVLDNENAIKYFLVRVPEQESAYSGSDALKEACDEFEGAFLGAQNIVDLRSDLIIPALENSEIVTECLSSNRAAMTDDGVITRSATADIPLQFVVTFRFGYEETRRSYPIVVKAIEQNKLIQNMEEDIDSVIQKLKDEHNLDRLTEDLSFPTKGKNGTELRYTSTNPSALSSSGHITRGEKEQTVILTVSGSYNGETVSKTVTVTIPEKGGSSVGGGGGLSGGGSGGGVSMKVDVDDKQLTQDEKTKSLFSDLGENHWAYEAVKYLYDRGIVNGMGDGRFAPDAQVTREQMVKMIVDSMPELSVSFYDHPFSDLMAGAWYEKYIATAYHYTLAKGIGDTEFGIGRAISRQDLALMILNALDVSGKTLRAIRESEPYSDETVISDYAKEAVETLTNGGLMNGRGENRFCPKESVTRAEAAVIIYRMLTAK